MAYRLIKSTEEDLWSIARQNDLKNDEDIIKFWKYATNSEFDIYMKLLTININGLFDKGLPY